MDEVDDVDTEVEDFDNEVEGVDYVYHVDQFITGLYTYKEIEESM
jgi:hypothetical protein